MIESHSEKEIYEACIKLMQSLTKDFKDYLDYLEINLEDTNEEEQFCIMYSSRELVNKLFLTHTDHSGATSTQQKCEELGIDPYTFVSFSFDENNN